MPKFRIGAENFVRRKILSDKVPSSRSFATLSASPSMAATWSGVSPAWFLALCLFLTLLLCLVLDAAVDDVPRCLSSWSSSPSDNNNMFAKEMLIYKSLGPYAIKVDRLSHPHSPPFPSSSFPFPKQIWPLYCLFVCLSWLTGPSVPEGWEKTHQPSYINISWKTLRDISNPLPAREENVLQEKQTYQICTAPLSDTPR